MQSPEQVQNQTQSHRRFGLLVVLFVSLCSFYMLTYSARIESTDTLFLFDAAGSLVRYGDLRLDISAGVRPPPPGSLPTDTRYPLPHVGAEPLQIILVTPLYWLASQIPGVGLVHVVYLFNILVSAAAACVLFLYARTLGYDERVGVLAALLLAVGTIVWPYSKTFFQEPLTLLLILSCALMLEKWRASGYHALYWLLLALALGVAAAFSKAAAVLALPALLVIVAPRLTVRRALLLGLVGLALAGLVVLFGETLGIAGRINQLVNIVRRPSPALGVALHSYLLSIGGSVWATSPVILLAIPGVWLSRRWRHGLALGVIALSFALVYALWQGQDWFGGLSWPPRFLIPVVPFGLIAALPALDRALRRPYPNAMLLVTLALLLYAVWVQLSAVTLWWGDYSAALPPEANRLGEWGGGLNVVRYLRWVVIPALWPQADFDFAWVRLGVPLWPVAFGGLALIGSYLLWQRLRGQRLPTWSAAALAGGFALAALLGLRAIADDPLFQADNQQLHDMQAMMQAETRREDVVLLSSLAYERFFTQHERPDSPRIVSLPFQPGEQPSPEQPPEVVAENPEALIHRSTGPLIFALAQQHERLFVLADSGPFHPWSVRPVERFMAAYYYPVREWSTGPQVRLIEYSTAQAPAPYAFLGPQYTTDLVYGDHITLAGYELPNGTRYAPGDPLPVSLYWRTDAALEARYTIAWFLRDASGGPVAQGWDSEPGMGFAPTDSWRPGVPVWDNRALQVPPDTPPGEYRLWVVLYTTAPDGTLVNLPVQGTETVEGTIGVLPAAIIVEE